jgi:hypothetical protein
MRNSKYSRKTVAIAALIALLLVGFAYCLQHTNLSDSYDVLVGVGRLVLFPGILVVTPLSGLFGYSLHNSTDLDWLMAIVSWLFYTFLFARAATAFGQRRARTARVVGANDERTHDRA